MQLEWYFAWFICNQINKVLQNKTESLRQDQKQPARQIFYPRNPFTPVNHLQKIEKINKFTCIISNKQDINVKIDYHW